MQLDKLGLKANPFKNNTDHRYFYADQNRAQILESTEHLIEYSTNFQVIIGETGVGKSHFQEAIANRIDNNWRIAKVNNAQQYDTLSLIQTILDAFGAMHGGRSDLMEALETQLAEINELGFKPVLLVDSSQSLSIDSLRFLIQLSQQKQDEEPYVNIVLFATAEITELLQGSELRDFRDIIHIATLNRFDKEGMSGYLRHKMAVAGYDRQSPFTPRIIDSIFKDSQGLPEKINFFADKFLVSSGKAESYIEVATADQGNESAQFESQSSLEQDNSSETDLNNQTDKFTSSLEQDSFLQEHQSDRAEEQLNRLAEKFAEIEQLEEQSVNPFFADNDQNNNALSDAEQADNFFSDEPLTPQYDDKRISSALPKFIIPVAVIGLLFVAVIVINSVFEKSEQSSRQAGKEKIALLPLELPPQDSVQIQQKNNARQAGIENTPKKALSNNSSPPEIQTPIFSNIPPEINKEAQNTIHPEIKAEINIVGESDEVVLSDVVTQADVVTRPNVVTRTGVMNPLGATSKLDVIELLDSGLKTGKSPLAIPLESADKEPEVQQRVIPDTNNVRESVSVSKPAPGLTRIDPEPVIGSNSRQTITILGNNLEKDTSLVVSWMNNKKEFSAEQTPEQWQYINKNTIKLHLSTGIKAQQWQVTAKSVNGTQSQSISFAVAKPFIANMTIKSIMPNPFIGSDKRQAVTIFGQGFSKQTVLELKWDKNKKYFSSRLTPSQFEFISAKQIKLFIATGSKERKWRVQASNPSGNTSTSSFVVKNADKELSKQVSQENVIKNTAAVVYPGSTLKDENWLKQQPDSNYTIQLFASHNKEAINELVDLYALKGDILRFETQKDGKSWFTMTYGNFASKQDAHTAIAALDPVLANPTPWVRSMASIKEKLSLVVKQASKPQLRPDAISVNKDEAWIWTQNPTDFTIQLIALSSEQSIKDYMKQAGIQSESVYFKTIRDGKALYILLYGKYTDKQLAKQAGENLATKIKGSAPWVRSFSTVHEMMSSR